MGAGKRVYNPADKKNKEVGGGGLSARCARPGYQTAASRGRCVCGRWG